MKFTEKLTGAYLIENLPIEDERGSFGRIFCQEEFKSLNLETNIVQINHSKSAHKCTLRGMHFQVSPFQETKIVKCIKGSLFDVIIDLRPGSKTYKQWTSVELTEKSNYLFYVPKGFAHGFYTLEDDTELIYFVTAPYSKKHERGLRFDDPTFSIEWPGIPKVISDKDIAHPNFDITLLS